MLFQDHHYFMLLIPTGGQQRIAYGTFAQLCLRVIHQVLSHYLILHQMFLDDVSTMKWEAGYLLVSLLDNVILETLLIYFKLLYLFFLKMCLFSYFFCTFDLSLPVKRLPYVLYSSKIVLS